MYHVLMMVIRKCYEPFNLTDFIDVTLIRLLHVFTYLVGVTHVRVQCAYNKRHI